MPIMKQQRHGTLIWEGCKVEWWYESLNDQLTLDPHFKLTVSNDKESITWPHVTVDTDELVDSLKGIHDFTKLPADVFHSVLDNCVRKLNEPEQEITRLNPYGS